MTDLLKMLAGNLKKAFLAMLVCMLIMLLTQMKQIYHRTLTDVSWDVHTEDGHKGHTGQVHVHQGAVKAPDIKLDGKNIAIGCAVTSHGIEGMTSKNVISKYPLMYDFLPSFCRTASVGYHYHFYITYDLDDPFFTMDTSKDGFRRSFIEVVKRTCAANIQIAVHMVQCTHSKKPAWAQNDAMMEAYLDGMDYLYRINDDTQLESPGWTERFIQTLQAYDPPNVGVVGPHHMGGNMAILTYDFTSRKHIEIFGFHYPRLFIDWFGDDWVTMVYKPGRSTKLVDVRIRHMLFKSRYKEHVIANKLQGRLDLDKATLNRYLAAKTTSNTKPDGTKVISFTLWGADSQDTYGAVRNAQLAPVYFPGWQVRVYTETPSNFSKYGAVPLRMLRTLRSLGAEIMYVNSSTTRIPPAFWNLLVADDPRVEHFIVRDVKYRLSDREVYVVKDWIDSGKAVHCIRDHPYHKVQNIVPGLWGANSQKLKQILGASMTNILEKQVDFQSSKPLVSFLQAHLWNKIKDDMYCHDSVSCTQWPNSHPFNRPREGFQFLGQTFGPYEEEIEKEIKDLQADGQTKECMDAKAADKPLSGVVIWNMDYHIAPIHDIQNLLEPLGAKFIINSFSGHCDKTQTCAKDLRIVTAGNAMEASQEVIDKFYTEYAHDPTMAQVTHFLCTFPVAMCELYMKFGKPLILISTTRYEHGRYMLDRWEILNKNILTMSKDPQNTIAANNMYDQKYMEYFTGIKPTLIQNYCGYVEASYNPSHDEFLIPDYTYRDWFMQPLQQEINKQGVKISLKNMAELNDKYDYKQLSTYKGIVIVPYQVSMISVREYYAMNIPLFFPSQKLLITFQADKSVLHQRTWDFVRQPRRYSGNKSPISGVSSNPDPNTDTDTTLTYWLPFADFYKWPYIVYFSSFDELVQLLADTDLNNISSSMKKYNSQLKRNVIAIWKEVLKKR